MEWGDVKGTGTSWKALKKCLESSGKKNLGEDSGLVYLLLPELVVVVKG